MRNRFNLYGKLVLSVFIVASFCLIFSSCSKKDKQKSYTFGGSSTVAPIMNDAIKEFSKENSDVKISYETLGSSVGIKELLNGTLTLAASSRDLKESELKEGLNPIVIALDGISIVVNKDVNVSNLSEENLAKIFSAEITNWSELGGKDEKIEIITRDETSGTYTTFKEMILDKNKKEISDNAIVAKENGEVALKVASLSGSIGYVGMAFNSFVEENGGKVVQVDGVLPTKENVKDGNYPLARPLYLVSKGNLSSGCEKDFCTFLLSEEGQKCVENNGFISIL